MTPSQTANDFTDDLLANAKAASEGGLAFAVLTGISDFLNFLIPKLRGSIFDATSWVFSLATFPDHIRSVIGPRAKEQMARITARRIVTVRAIVKNANTVRNFAFVDLPRNAVSALLRAVKIKLSVTAIGLVTAYPKPTLVRTTSIDVTPKSFELISPSFLGLFPLRLTRIDGIFHELIKSKMRHSFKVIICPIR